MPAPANEMAGCPVGQLRSALKKTRAHMCLAVSRQRNGGGGLSGASLAKSLDPVTSMARDRNAATCVTISLQQPTWRLFPHDRALSSLRHMASDTDQASYGFFLAFQVFSLSSSLKRLNAYGDAYRAAKDAGNGGAFALLCQGGLLHGASRLVRALSGARGPFSDRIDVAVVEAVSFITLAVDCAAAGAVRRSLLCVQLYVGIVSLLGPIGAVEVRQKLAELQDLLALPNEWEGGQVTHLTRELCFVWEAASALLSYRASCGSASCGMHVPGEGEACAVCCWSAARSFWRSRWLSSPESCCHGCSMSVCKVWSCLAPTTCCQTASARGWRAWCSRRAQRVPGARCGPSRRRRSVTMPAPASAATEAAQMSCLGKPAALLPLAWCGTCFAAAYRDPQVHAFQWCPPASAQPSCCTSSAMQCAAPAVSAGTLIRGTLALFACAENAAPSLFRVRVTSGLGQQQPGPVAFSAACVSQPNPRPKPTLQPGVQEGEQPDMRPAPKARAAEPSSSCGSQAAAEVRGFCSRVSFDVNLNPNPSPLRPPAKQASASAHSSPLTALH